MVRNKKRYWVAQDGCEIDQDNGTGRRTLRKQIGRDVGEELGDVREQHVDGFN